MLNKISPFVSSAFIGKSLHRVISWFPLDSKEATDFQRAMMSMIRAILGADERQLTSKDVEIVRGLLKKLPVDQQEVMISLLYSEEKITLEEVTEVFSQLPELEQQQLISTLITLAIRSENLESSRELIAKLAEMLHIDADKIAHIYAEQQALNQQRNRILRSGAGIIVALIVIVVFILTATLLRAVVFGLIFAFVMLPLEQYFERKLKNPHSLASGIFGFFSYIIAPLRKLPLIVQQRTFKVVEPPLNEEQKIKKRIGRAVVLTCSVLTIVVMALALWLGVFSVNYVKDLKHNHQQQQSSTVAPKSEVKEDKKTETQPAEESSISETVDQVMAPVFTLIEKLRGEFDQSPLVKSVLNQIAKSLHNEESQKALLSLFLRSSGGVFSFTTGVLSEVSTLVMDLLMAVFFFMLFLSKLAEFCVGKDSQGRQGEYLVRSIFNGNWLPGASETTIAEAERIISEVINKLKIWMRGYFWLILLDTTVYSMLFYFLRLPYFFLLGALAGCGILLPYIGPIVSAVVTVAVTLAVGGADASSGQILGILIGYLIYNGVIEQFIVYPLVIGESLGLTALETIIVVLLGAIFAGIPGMILAIPTASVLKYLVPQIYNCFEQRKRPAIEEKKEI